MAPRKGLVQVYTGNGKGKTTAALGLALRASGQGLRVGFLQFLKGNSRCGEHLATAKYPIFTIIQPSSRSVFRQPDEARRLIASEALARARDMMSGGEYDLLVLDEVLTAVKVGALDLGEVLDLVRSRPCGLEVVLTGRGAPPEITSVADLVTEMVPHKHPLEQGIGARRGIEY